jgi:uncharacterized membrane protein
MLLKVLEVLLRRLQLKQEVEDTVKVNSNYLMNRSESLGIAAETYATV